MAGSGWFGKKEEAQPEKKETPKPQAQRFELQHVNAAVCIDRENNVVAIISTTDDIISAWGFSSRESVNRLIEDLAIARDAMWPNNKALSDT